MTTFHHLAPELLVLIQGAVDSTRDLYSLIAASPPCLHTFILDRNRILSSVLKNAIQPGALRHAVAIYHIPPRLIVPHQRRRRRREASASIASSLDHFLDKYFSEDTFEFPSDMAGLAALCRLQDLVSRFADDYLVHVAGMFGAHQSSPQDIAVKFPPPSRTEWTRIQRAFFRYELYCRIFPSMDGVSSLDSRDQFRLFVERLAPWEAEEMSCVYNYFTFLVGKYIDDLEEQVVQAVLTSPGVRRLDKCRPGSPEPRKRRARGMATQRGFVDDTFVQYSRSSSPQGEDDDADLENLAGAGDSKSGSDYGDELVPFDDLELCGLSLFDRQHQRYVPAFISNMASHGLRHMRQLVDADSDQRAHMIQKHATLSRDFLPEALEHSPPSDPDIPQFQADVAPTSVDQLRAKARDEAASTALGTVDEPSHANMAYHLFQGKTTGAHYESTRVHHRIYDNFKDLEYSPLRERGYVFWDSSRLEIQAIRQSLQQFRAVSRAVIASKSRLQRTSVQERLQGIRLPWSQMQKIADSLSKEESDYDSEA